MSDCPTTEPTETSATCDWGNCDYTSRFWRLSEKSVWLPVCFAHSESGEQFYASLQSSYTNTRGTFA